MSELLIYGASDDLIEFEGAIREEFNVSGTWKGMIESPDGRRLVIAASFGQSLSDWQISVANADTPFPDWPMHFTTRPDREDDPALIIDVPAGSFVHALRGRR